MAEFLAELERRGELDRTLIVFMGDNGLLNGEHGMYNYEKQFPYTPNVRGVRTDQWKYIHYPHGDGSPDHHKAELYNIEFDPEEHHNLIDNPKYVPEVKALQKELARLRKTTGLTPQTDKMPIDEGIKKELPDQKIR